ncbi:MAG: cation-translocating P-type ATPase [Bacteroidota bacterium]|nr:cation-translocating P-type ATPase [Bacteroidota bacterium]
MTTGWHLQDIATILETTDSSIGGLTTPEAERRLKEYGYNEITEGKKKSAGLLFLYQFKNFMIIALIGAAVVSAIVGDMVDTLVIIAIVILNAIVGFVQEYRAEKAMEVLKNMAVSNARVIRNNILTTLSSRYLVPGDIIWLEAGDIVPADVRLTETIQLKLNESALTGESEVVEKNTRILNSYDLGPGDYSNMALKGTYITNGRGKGIVVGTGMKTELGEIAALIQEPGAQTALQKKMADLAKNLAYIILSVCAVIFLIGYLRGETVTIMLLTALSLAVAAVPEALPAVITIALANGAKKMAKKNALIRKLSAVETLGSVTYICTDKTGTLTVNKMTVEEIAGRHFSLNQNSDVAEFDLEDDYKQMLRGMALNNDVYLDEKGRILGDPTEIGLYEFAHAKGYNKSDLEKLYPRVAEIPFDSDRKCMTTIHRYGTKYIAYTKGAAEILFSRSEDGSDIARLESELNKMLSAGFRVLAFASREFDTLPFAITPEIIESHLQLAGIAGIIDPPRREAIQAVHECKTAGIRTIMITGDHPVTATTIAKRLDILDTKDDRVLTGSEMKVMSEQQMREAVVHVKVYARVSPEQKLNIVKALQKNGEYVAMTGDGVNDAPALKRADIGVAMGITGTDVSKEAAQLILLDDNFATIVKAVKEGRRIFDNIRKFICYILIGNSAEIWVIFLAPLLSLPIPLLPLQILWINLVTDSLPGLALSAERAERNTMHRPPRAPDQSIFADRLGLRILWIGLFFGLLTLGTQAFAIRLKDTHWQTMVFTILCVGQLFLALAMRSEKLSFFRLGAFSNPALLFVVAGSFIVQMALIYNSFFNTIFKTQPLTVSELAFCLVISSMPFFVVETGKLFNTENKKMKYTPI